MATAIEFNHVGKQYRLGLVSTRTLSHDLNRWWQTAVLKKEDPYLNALQIKYAYAVTCHKAQGGQWSQVFIDQGYVTPDMMGLDYYRWLYTAFTRATENVYLVNWPEKEVSD